MKLSEHARKISDNKSGQAAEQRQQHHLLLHDLKGREAEEDFPLVGRGNINNNNKKKSSDSDGDRTISNDVCSI